MTQEKSATPYGLDVALTEIQQNQHILNGCLEASRQKIARDVIHGNTFAYFCSNVWHGFQNAAAAPVTHPVVACPARVEASLGANFG